MLAIVFSIQDVLAQTSNQADNGLAPYVNSNYKFSIQYPQGWQTKEEPTTPKAIVMFSNLQENVLITIDKKQYDTSQHSLKEFADGVFSVVRNEISNFTLIDEGPLTVSGQDAYFIEYGYSSSNTSLITKLVLVKTDSKDTYAITFASTNPAYQDQVRQFDNVVSTFEINTGGPTNPQATQANSTDNGYVNYVNMGHNFSINRPQNWTVQENPTNPSGIVSFFDPQGDSGISIDERKYDLLQDSLKTYADLSFARIQKVISDSSILSEGPLILDGKNAYFIEYRLSSGGTSTITKVFLVEADSNDVYTIACVTTNVPYESQLNQFDYIAYSFNLEGENADTNSSSTPSPQSASSSQILIPSWVRNTAKWWSEGQVGDSDFTKGIQYLIQQGIIHVPSASPSGSPSQQIPVWIKTNAKWWAEGQISDYDFIKGIQWLVSNGIINMSPDSQQSQ